MKAAAPLAALAIGGVLLLALGGSKEQTPAPATGTEPTPEPSAPPAGSHAPKSILERVVAAVKTNDPNAIRAEAQRLESEGYPEQAHDLRKAADIVAIAQSLPGITTPQRATTKKPKPPAPTSPGPRVQGDVRRAPAEPQPYSPIPGLIDAMVEEPEIDPKRVRAQALINELERKPRGQESRELVAQFQRDNGLKASGNYTPATALQLAVTYGLVPPAPYWPKRGRVKTRENYRAVLLRIAERDPQRAEEFRRAARV